MPPAHRISLELRVELFLQPGLNYLQLAVATFSFSKRYYHENQCCVRRRNDQEPATVVLEKYFRCGRAAAIHLEIVDRRLNVV